MKHRGGEREGITHRQNSLASLAILSNLQASTIKMNHFRLQGVAHKSDVECRKCKQRWVMCLLKHRRAYKCSCRVEYKHISGAPRPIIIYWLHRDEHLALNKRIEHFCRPANWFYSLIDNVGNHSMPIFSHIYECDIAFIPQFYGTSVYIKSTLLCRTTSIPYGFKSKVVKSSQLKEPKT